MALASTLLKRTAYNLLLASVFLHLARAATLSVFPDGDLELCRPSDDPDYCAMNPRSKSFLICAPHSEFSKLKFVMNFSSEAISHNNHSLPYHNTEAQRVGATGTTLSAESPNPDMEKCNEILFRFWPMENKTNSHASFTVRLVHSFSQIELLYNITFDVRYSDANDVTTTEDQIATTTEAITTTTNKAIESEATTMQVTYTTTQKGAEIESAPVISAGILPPFAIVVIILIIAVIVIIVLAVIVHRTRTRTKQKDLEAAIVINHSLGIQTDAFVIQPVQSSADIANCSSSEHDTSCRSDSECDVSHAELLPSPT